MQPDKCGKKSDSAGGEVENVVSECLGLLEKCLLSRGR